MAKRQRRGGGQQARNGPSGRKANAARRVGYLVVHGIGNQHRKAGTEQSVLHHMGKSLVDPIATAYGPSAVEWEETTERSEATADAPYGEPAHATARIRVPDGPTAEVLIAEAVWSNRFSRLPRWLRVILTLGYLGWKLPAVLMLVGPDRRDHAVGLPATEGFGLLMRFAWRMLTLIVLSAAMLTLATAHPWVALAIALIALGLLGTRLNLVEHVITAAARDTEREALLDYLEDRLRWLERRCDAIVIVAHSQGGYLAHQLLGRDGGRNQKKVVRLVGVGSGLKPIWVLRQTRRPVVLALSWLLPAASLCLARGLLPLAADPSGMAGAMKAMAISTRRLAVPLASSTPASESAERRDIADAVQPHSLTDLLPFGGMTGMDGMRWTLVAVGVLLSVGCALLTRHFFKSSDRDALKLPKGPGGKLDWRELSSQHDMVGRMLLPTLPAEVEQDATPVLGHALRDHTMYFAPDGMLVRQLAGDLLSDLQTATKRSFGATEWRDRVARYTQALRKQHDRRRAFHGLLILAVTFVVLVPRLALGASLPGAVVDTCLPLAVVSFFLSYVFTGRGRTSMRKTVATLDAELRGGSAHEPLLAIVPPGRRLVPASALALSALLAAYGALWLTRIQQLLPHWQVAHPGAGLIAGVVLVVMAAATASGYRVKRRWALGAAALVAIPPLASRIPHPAGVPAWAAAPGLMSAMVIAMLVGIAVIALTRTVPVPLPAPEER
ncbi:hypothetical protein [Streptomyces sp. Isolate_219]|uniref:hypothetical protein n=1 Tax=Streptomyces sp. Isolate_219 TaxID=2950110 RepID=UPI0021C5FD36|nr:hypothetical protein [Streptomyces sp. Isolate_219]MCR8573589.1 hypothetical protein [Streptomyces sp. Isolate_219]